MFQTGHKPAAAAAATTTTQQVVRKTSVLALDSLLGAPLSRASHGEIVSKITEGMQAIAKDINTSLWDKTLVIPLDNQSNSLQLSSVHLIGLTKDRAVVYTMILDGTGAARQPREFKGNSGRLYYVPRVAGDLYNDTYWGMVVDLLKPHVNVERIEDAGATVIPAGFDVENKVALRTLMNCAANAISHLYGLYLAPEERVFFTAATFADTDWVARTTFQPGVGTDAVDTPIRRNFEITTTGRVKGANSDVTRDTVTLSSVSGFVNLQYVGKTDLLDQYHRPVFGEQQYLPVINITNTALESSAITPELQMFALLTSFRLSQRGAWMNCFRPRYNQDQSKNLHRLDGIGKELGLVVDSTDPQFDAFAFLRQYAYEQPVFALHIDQVGPMSWLMNMLADAGAGVPEAQDAVFGVIERLTNGNFSANYKPTQGVPAFETADDLQLAGWYVDNDGIRQDLRDIDVLAILNLTGTGDTSLAMEFEQTFNPTTGTPEERIHRRVEIIDQVTGGQAKYEGYRRLVYISGEVLEAAMTAVQQAGMNIRSEGTSDVAAAPIRENLAMRRFAVRSVENTQRAGAVAGQWAPVTRTAYHR